METQTIRLSIVLVIGLVTGMSVVLLANAPTGDASNNDDSVALSESCIVKVNGAFRSLYLFNEYDGPDVISSYYHGTRLKQCVYLDEQNVQKSFTSYKSAESDVYLFVFQFTSIDEMTASHEFYASGGHTYQLTLLLRTQAFGDYYVIVELYVV